MTYTKESRRPVTALSTRANFAWVAASTIYFQLCQWLMLAALAQTADSEAVGRFALALAVTAPPVLLANLNLRVVLATDVRSEFPFADYLILRTGCLTVMLAATAAVAAVVTDSAADLALILAVALAKTLDAFSDIAYGLLQKYERMDRIAISRSLQGTLQVLALVLTFHVTGDLVAAVAAWAAASGAVTLSYDARSVLLLIRNHASERYRRDGMGPRFLRLVRLAVPLAGTATLGALISNLPTYALSRWRTVTEVGVFSAQMRLVTVVSLAFAALVQVATPRIARSFVEGSTAFRRLMRMMFCTAGVSTAIGLAVTVLAGHDLLVLVYGEGYADQGLLILLMLAAGANLVSVVLGMAVSAARAFTAQFWIGLAQFGATGAALAVLTPGRGAAGAALAFLFGIGVYAGLLAVVMARRIAAAGMGKGAEVEGQAAWTALPTSLPRQRTSGRHSLRSHRRLRRSPAPTRQSDN